MSKLESARDQVVDEFTNVMNEAEDLLNQAGKETGEAAREIRAVAEKKLRAAKARMQQLEGQAYDQATAAAKYTDEYVSEHPWAAVGVAAAVGFIFGVLLTRR
jgi:ElaB/YqjD/DUF883 family membrane-anchored ribosome-binding protein